MGIRIKLPSSDAFNGRAADDELLWYRADISVDDHLFLSAPLLFWAERAQSLSQDDNSAVHGGSNLQQEVNA